MRRRRSMLRTAPRQPHRAHPTDHGHRSDAPAQTMESRQGIRSTAGNPDHAEFVEPEGRRDILHVVDGYRERLLRSTNSDSPTPGPVRSDDPKSLLPRLIGDIRRLVVRADHAVEEEHGMPRGIPVFLDFQLPAGSRDENVVEHQFPAGMEASS